jgi:hypothetical protein
MACWNLSRIPLRSRLSVLLCALPLCALPVGCGILVTFHEEDGSHEFEFTSLVGMRTSHVCALRTYDLYA